MFSMPDLPVLFNIFALRHAQCVSLWTITHEALRRHIDEQVFPLPHAARASNDVVWMSSATNPLLKQALMPSVMRSRPYCADGADYVVIEAAGPWQLMRLVPSAVGNHS